MTSKLQNTEAEQQLLGILLSLPVEQACRSYHRVAGLIDETDFIDGLHARIYAEAKTRLGEGRAVNAVLLAPLFGGEERDYLAILSGCVTSFTGISDYAQEIAECSARRKLIGLSKSIAEGAEGGESPQAVAARATQDIARIYTPGTAGVGMADAIASLETALANPASITTTGIDLLDKALGGGLHAGRMYGIAARMKKGKSALMGTLAYNAAAQGKNIAYITLEMSRDELALRFLARASGLYPATVRDKPHLAAKGKALLSDFKLSIFDFKRVKLERLLMELSRLGYAGKTDGVVIDYIQLVGGKGRNQSQAEHYDEVAQAMAETAKQFGYWVLTAAQLNRSGEIRGSDGLLNACDAAFNLDSEMIGGPDDTYMIQAWLEMAVMRYSGWQDIGSKDNPELELDGRGPYFRHKYDKE